MIYNSIIETIGNTPIVRINNMDPDDQNIFVKCEAFNPLASVKDRLAIAIINDAEESGKLSPRQTVVEATSGNTGIGLALISKIKGYKIVCVMPENVSEERSTLLRSLGAEIIYSDGEYGSNGAIARAKEIVTANPGKYFFPYQYGNEANPRAHYEGTGPEILHDLPQITAGIMTFAGGGILYLIFHLLLD